MRRFILLPITGLVLISACDNAKKPSDANFSAAINQYLTKHGAVCTVINRQFPVDVPRSSLHDAYGVEPKLEALEHAGLLSAADTTATLHGMLEPLQGPTAPQPVRHYELTGEGRKYLKQVPGIFGRTNAFCYGQKTVDSIAKWTEPTTVGTLSRTEVTYAYKIFNLAAWASRPDVQQVFPDIKAVLVEAGQPTQLAGLQLTDLGWDVPSP